MSSAEESSSGLPLYSPSTWVRITNRSAPLICGRGNERVMQCTVRGHRARVEAEARVRGVASQSTVRFRRLVDEQRQGHGAEVLW